MEENTNVKFRLASIEDVQISKRFEGFDFSSLDESGLRFQYKIDTVIRMSRGIVSVIPSVRYSYGDRELLTASAMFNFSVLNMESAISVDRDNQQVNVRANIFPTFLAASYSSLRGMVFAGTSDSGLRQFPMPMIEVDALMARNGISVEE